MKCSCRKTFSFLARGLVVITAIFLLVNTSWAQLDIEQCWSLVSRDADHYPIKVSKEITVVGTRCGMKKDGPAYIFQHRIDLHKSSITEQIIRQTESRSSRIICSDPSLVKLLRQIDMGYVFYDIKSVYIGEFMLQINDCR